MFEKAYSFDDVCLVPQYNNVSSRTEPLLETWLTKGTRISQPLIPANMILYIYGIGGCFNK